MADLLYLATIVAFFALMVVFVRICERIVGKDDVVTTDGTLDSPDTYDATIAEEVRA